MWSWEKPVSPPAVIGQGILDVDDDEDADFEEDEELDDDEDYDEDDDDYEEEYEDCSGPMRRRREWGRGAVGG